MPIPLFPPPDQAEVLVLGGGITGISLASLLARKGRSTVLVEKHDFASGTSQASGMMIWGGLLYLRNLEFRTVSRFCRSRDRLIRRRPDEIAPRRFTYLVARKGGRSSWVMWSALQLYRAFSWWRRAPVRGFDLDRLPRDFDRSLYATAWTYEEGFLARSDSTFALRQLGASGGPLTALNYHEVVGIRLLADGYQEVTLQDSMSSATHVMKVGKIVNCGGVWADEINARFGITTRHHHHLSKGVYLLLHTTGDEAFVMDSGEGGDVLCWVPWSEVTMWGPTETSIPDLTAARATTDDVDWLLAQLNRRSTRKWTRDDVANVRCGVRPLAKLPETPVRNPLDLSRKAVIEGSTDRAWWTVFGGKLSGAEDVATEIHQALFGKPPPQDESPPFSPPPPMIRDYFGGREIPDPAHCRDHGFCRTLDDFLRRRSNIAQWIPRGGFGRNDEFAADVLAIATRLLGDPSAAETALRHYRERVTLEEKSWHD